MTNPVPVAISLLRHLVAATAVAVRVTAQTVAVVARLDASRARRCLTATIRILRVVRERAALRVVGAGLVLRSAGTHRLDATRASVFQLRALENATAGRRIAGLRSLLGQAALAIAHDNWISRVRAAQVVVEHAADLCVVEVSAIFGIVE